MPATTSTGICIGYMGGVADTFVGVYGAESQNGRPTLEGILARPWVKHERGTFTTSSKTLLDALSTGRASDRKSPLHVSQDSPTWHIIGRAVARLRHIRPLNTCYLL